jgi:deoxyadenosine/deoxycytidine kinase
MLPFPYNFISIEGNIGAGKTTLCKMMEKDFGCRLILEQFTDNPFLPYFYENPDRYAFPVELFFMTERHKQLQESLSQLELFPQLILADYFFIKTLLFAKNNLSTEEFRLFQRLFHTLNSTFKKPDLLVYLHRSVDDLIDNIRNRGREFEKNIQPSYLQSLQDSYFSYFRTAYDMPILVINVTKVHFWRERKYYRKIVKLLQDNWKPGLNTVELK